MKLTLMWTSKDRLIVKRFKKYLKLNAGNDELIDIEKAAASDCITSWHLNHSCKNFTGKTSSQIIAEVYLKKAILISEKEGLNESEIVYRLGFKNISNFCHFIKRHTHQNFKAYLTLIHSSTF